MVSGVHEGFHAMPTMYGSEVRDVGEVTGIRSGVVEGVRVSSIIQIARSSS